jgi:trans-AT polyketide synthase/acyltransferase/oxidoreductase domain-containing protein
MKHQKGWYIPGDTAPEVGRSALLWALQTLHLDFAVVVWNGETAVIHGGTYLHQGPKPQPDALPVLAWVPTLLPSQLGHPSFQEHYGVRANYVAGAMANGIASEAMVIEMARAGLMGFFGAAGLSTDRISQAIDTLQTALGPLPFGINLIHSPQTPQQEWDSVDLFLRRSVRTLSASAFMKVTAPLVWFRVKGLHRNKSGEIITPNRVMAKVSRQEVARQFLNPPPKKLLAELLAAGKLSPDEVALAAHIPMADDLTAEADSGGHTDRQAAPVLIPLMCALRDQTCAEAHYPHRIRVGAAGGISTPASVLAAFSAGADYVLTGSINQACIEAGTSDMVKALLAQACTSDVDMGPAGDMFEQGAQVQVLKRGTLFAMRGRHLYSLYKRYDSLESLPVEVVKTLEKQIFRRTLDAVWSDCQVFFERQDPAQLIRAKTEPRHKMALVFRWYLGLSSRWAITGDESRKSDTQIWCGPAIGAFNAWTQDTFLARPDQRGVAVVAANLMAGAAALSRARRLLEQGVDPGPKAHQWVPRPLSSPAEVHP